MMVTVAGFPKMLSRLTTFIMVSLNNLYQVENARCFTKLTEPSIYCCYRNKIAFVRSLSIAEFKKWHEIYWPDVNSSN